MLQKLLFIFFNVNGLFSWWGWKDVSYPLPTESHFRPTEKTYPAPNFISGCLSLYGGGTDTQTYESTLHAASDDHGIEAGGYFNKCSWNHLAMFISASLSASTLLIGWLLSGYESNLALVP